MKTYLRVDEVGVNQEGMEYGVMSFQCGELEDKLRPKRAAGDCGVIFLIIFFKCLYYTIAVSYTHLDVYKRQPKGLSIYNV